MNILIKHNNKKINLNVKKCRLFGMVRGLMFRQRKNAPALLLFDFGKPIKLKIHSLFVFFPFIAIWLDDKNEIIELRKIPPWKFKVQSKKTFYKLIEIPCNKKYSEFIHRLISRR